MSFIQEFKTFAVKGNAIDLAVGVIIGGGFGKIVDSVVNDLILPIVSAIFGKPDFTSQFVVMGKNPDNLTVLADLKKAGIPVFAYGSFLTALVSFLLLALVVFFVVKFINHLKAEEKTPEAAPAAPAEDIVLLREIRDSLKK